MRQLYTMLLVFLFSMSLTGQKSTIVKWDFDGTTDPSFGIGSASLTGGTTEHSVDSESGWRFYNFPKQGELSGTAGVEFMFSTLGFEDITITFEQRASGTASRWALFEYTTDGGDTWEEYGDNMGGLNPRDIFHFVTLDFSDNEEVHDNPDFGIRVVSIYSPVAFNPGEPDIDFGSNVAYHRARDADDGGDAYRPGGNWRVRDFQVSGMPVSEGTPSELSFGKVHGGNDIYLGYPFSVVLYFLDEEGNSAAVDNDTEVTLRVVDGAGDLDGDITAVAEAGRSYLLFDNLKYNESETTVVLGADADGYLSVESDMFDVLLPGYTFEVENGWPGAGTVLGGDDYLLYDDVTLVAEAGDGFLFDSWVDEEGYILSNSANYNLEMTGELLYAKALFKVDKGEEVFHYWHFNDLSDEDEISMIESDHSSIRDAEIRYRGSGEGYMDRYDPGSKINLYDRAEKGYALRVRNPSFDRELLIDASSAGYESLNFSYVVHRSNNGPDQQTVYYSVDGGANWEMIEEITNLSTSYTIFSFDLSHIDAVNNCEELMMRILFTGDNNTGISGNNRFDNIMLSGDPIPGWEDPVNIENSYDRGKISIFPNPATDYLNVHTSGLAREVTIYSLTGNMVFSSLFENYNIQVDLSDFNPGLYIIKIAGEYGQTVKTSKFIVQ
ncbi:T9SS type A sorting domain-containing protein [Marinilabiliaceae bacterium ANBcel2]|nr:T9SS type A sorting domain-containing protein [Marinilabiliaceae bacterium ANBcel2]